jgi:molecular chaperone HtpG
MGGGPFMTIHNKAEGTLEYTNLLFIPAMKPFDLFHPDRKGRLKLYVKKVFISEELELAPAWLRFIRGIIDSQDLPLNISRETLQHNLVLAKIKTAIIKKILSELKKKSEKSNEEYLNFWNNFGAVLKEGLCEPGLFKDKIFEICRFYSSKSPDKLISLKEYLENSKENQDKIYYLTAESIKKAKSSPQLEGFVSKDIDVLFLTDPVDEFWVTVSNNYQEKEFKSITRSDIDLENIDKTQEEKDSAKDDKEAKDVTDSSFSDLTKFFKEILKDNIKEAKVSKKLTNSPVCLAVDSNAMDIRMERYMLDQNQIPAGTSKILEINPNHQIIRNLNGNLQNESKKEENIAIIKTLFDQACIIEGEPIIDNKDFSQRLVDLIIKSSN